MNEIYTFRYVSKVTMATSEGRGLFIVIEGLDRSGKTTQWHLLADYFRKKEGSRVFGIHFPDTTESVTGVVLHSYLKGDVKMDPHTSHLLFSANRWENAKQITSMLDRGYPVIVDRYSYSGIAYSMAKGIPYTFASSTENGLPAPDVVIFLSNSPEVLQTREGYGEDIHDDISFQTLVRKKFEYICEREPSDRWRHIDVVGLSKEEVHSRIIEIVESTTPKMEVLGFH